MDDDHLNKIVIKIYQDLFSRIENGEIFSTDLMDDVTKKYMSLNNLDSNSRKYILYKIYIE